MFDSITDRVTALGRSVSDTLSRDDNDDRKGVWDAADDAQRSELDATVAQHLDEALPGKPGSLIDNTGTAGKMFISLIQRAASVQTSTVTSYVDWVRSNNQDASPREIQKVIDKHFQLLASGSGGTAGLASALPGIGLITGSVAIGAESLVFTDAAALYTLASGYLRGADISQKDRREALILVTLLGSKGTALVDATVGELGAGAVGMSSRSTLKALTQMAPQGVSNLNNKMTKVATKTVMKKLMPAWFGKLLPFGIGAVVGWTTSRSLSKKVIEHAQIALGPLPQSFPTPAPDTPTAPPAIVKVLEEAESDS